MIFAVSTGTLNAVLVEADDKHGALRAFCERFENVPDLDKVYIYTVTECAVFQCRGVFDMSTADVPPSERN